MVNRIGFNIEGGDLGSNRGQIVSELTSYRPNWQLCLGDEGLAVQLLAHVEQGVIYRIFDPFGEWTPEGSFDNEFWLNNSPGAVVQYILNTHSHLLHHDKLVFTVGNNEPTTDGKTADFVAWCVKLADIGKQHNIRFAIAEIASAKSIKHDEVIAGVWDDLIRTMDKYRGFHIFTVHEYTTGILPATFLPDYPLNLNQPDVLDHDNWKNAIMNLSTIEGNWHLGRGALISHVRAKQIGIEPIPFVVTETAFDWMSDVIESDNPEIEAQRKAVVEPLRTAFKPLMHDALRGSSGHQMYHDWLINKTGFIGDWNDYLFAQYRWLVDVYPDECEGFCIFALNRDWDIPQGHDMSLPRNDKFRQLIITQESVPVPDPIPVIFNPPLFDADVSMPSGYWNLRADMTTSSKDNGDITSEVKRMKVSKITNPAEGFNWYKYSRELTTHTETGYFADFDTLRIDYIEDSTTDIPEIPDSSPDIGLPEIEDMIHETLAPLFEILLVDVPVPDFTMSVPAIMKDYLISYHRGQSKLHEAIARRFESGTPTLSQIDAEIYGTPEVDKTFTNTTSPFAKIEIEDTE